MESCISVERELEKVLSKFSGIHDHTMNTLEDFIKSVENIRKELAEGPADGDVQMAQSLVLNQVLRRIQEATGRVGLEHKDLHSTVSKVGKTIDRNFVSDFSSVFTDGAFEDDETQILLNEIICEHFLRQGQLDIAEALSEEADLNLDPTQTEPFLELHRILGALKRRNLQPAMSWSASNREKLDEQNSSLEFKLHRLQFIELVSMEPNRQTEALQFAKNFARFADKHTRELQVLMGSLLYMKQGIHNSPYAFLLDPIYWDEICDVFTRDACALMGMSVESPLSVSIRAGCRALPPLLNIRQVMQQRQVSSVWTNKDELPIRWVVESANSRIKRFKYLDKVLPTNQVPFIGDFVKIVCALANKYFPPLSAAENESDCALAAEMKERALQVEIDLGSEHRYHSIFACPILRQQSTETNPPVRLICGHVISRDALHKLATGNKYVGISNTVKCPYCPVEQNPEDAKVVVF